MEPFGPDALPWWAQARARLSLLLLILVAGGGAAALAAATRGPDGAQSGCWIAEGPPAIRLRPPVVRAAVRRLGLAALPAARTTVRQGLSTPDAAWSGAPPQPLQPRASDVTGGYAVTWGSARGETFGVAAYRFASADAAATFVAQAISTRCRPGTAAGGDPTGPPGDRMLTRAAAGRSAPELDLFFDRGPTGYWLSMVPPRGASVTPADRTALARLACRLVQARCPAHRI